MTPIKQLRKRIIVHTPGFRYYRSKHLLLKKENFDAMIEIMPHRDKVRVCIYLFRKIDNKQKWAMNPIFFDGSEGEVTATIKEIVHVFEHDTVEFVTEAIRTLPHNVHSKLTQITMS